MERIRTLAELAAAVRAARLQRGWSQQDAAVAAGVSRRFVNMFEGGLHRNAEIWRVLALLDALNVDLHTSVEQSPTTAEQSGVLHPDDFDLDSHVDSFQRDEA